MDPELQKAFLEKLAAAGMDRELVEKAVRSNAYSHEAACYEMLYTQVQLEQSSRLSSRIVESGREMMEGVAALMPFNKQ